MYSEYWSRYHIKFSPFRFDTIVEESLKLMKEGYDVIAHSGSKIEIIASITGIDNLLSQGYTPYLTKNLYSESHDHGRK